MTGCNKGKNKKRVVLADESVYSSQNFTDLLIDSVAITTFFKTSAASDSIQNEVNQFYTRRNYQFAWLNKSGLTNAVPNFYSQLQSYSRDFADSSLNNKLLDSLIIAAQNDEKIFLLQKNRVQQLELLLTTTFFKYTEKAYSGITKDPLDLEWFIPRKKKSYQVLLDSLVSLTKGEKIQEPVNQYYVLLKEKLRQYRGIQKKGGLPTVITDKKLIVVGDSNTCLVNVKQHLILTGDLKLNDNTIYFTDSLAKAVQRFQHRMGLVENGKINIATIAEFNKPIDFRIKQMMVNMERLRWIPVEMENDYLLINIPEFRLHIFENKKQVWEMNVVVGKSATKTSIFKGNLSQIVLNPYWGIPTSIVKNEILPKISRNSNYLANNNMEVVNGNYRQKPGKNNALGKIKFLFPNNFSIYLHDTPSKGLFGESKRAFSHGCIRVSEPQKLALYLLRKDTNWNTEKVEDILKTDNETIIRVNPTVPVYIAYFTAWVDNTGHLNFRNDLYHLDDKLSNEIFGE
ncbi:murein L,D-transpeptidase [Emticicia sp.]|uniref:L,D-transpeptidase family protein n=1 Tax=Emticicia sp. TaxID=1930953 RepID=UPI00375312C7